MSQTPLFSVYLSQNGSKITTILDQTEADKLWRALYNEGIPFAIWTKDDATSRSTGLVVVPRRGGVTLNLEPAHAIPARPDNATPLTGAELAHMAQVAQPIPGWIPADKLPRGTVVFPDWSQEERDNAHALGAFAEAQLSGEYIEDEPAAIAPPPPVAPSPIAPGPVPPGPMPPGPSAPKTNNAGMERYQALQREASELGVSPLTQSAEALEAAIAAKHEEEVQNGVPA